MDTPRNYKLGQAQEAAEKWISAGILLGHVCLILKDAGEPDAQSRTKWELIFQLAHFQYGTELSYSRLFAANNAKNRTPGVPWSFASLLADAANAHQLLVSAAGFWRTLRRLYELMPFPELEELLSNQANTIRDTQAARNHMEHIAERIVEGRRSRRESPEMAKDTFQVAIGRLEFPEIVFGCEAFNLEAVASAVLSEGLRLSIAFENLFESRVEDFNSALIEHHAASG